MKVYYLTVGGLMDVLKHLYDTRSKASHEKSADAIVP